MKWYNVVIPIKAIGTYAVLAEDKEDAINKVRQGKYDDLIDVDIDESSLTTFNKSGFVIAYEDLYEEEGDLGEEQ